MTTRTEAETGNGLRLATPPPDASILLGAAAIARQIGRSAASDALTVEQRARIEMLIASRDIVLGVDSNGSCSVMMPDLIAVAQFIDSGQDPWKPTGA